MQPLHQLQAKQASHTCCSRKVGSPAHRRVARRAALRQVRAEAVPDSQNFLERAINSFSVFVTNSPLNEGKKRWFRRLAGDYDQQATQQKIQQLVDRNAVCVFSWTFCPFAKRAKALLTELGAEFTAVEMDQIPDGKAIKAELGMMCNRTSVPNVFISGKSYGGMNDGPGISKLHEKGELLPLLKTAGALQRS